MNSPSFDNWSRRAALTLALLGGLSWAQPSQGSDGPVPSSDDRFTVGDPSPIPAQPWWRQLDPDGLTVAVEEALAGNRDLRAALGRLDQAKALALAQAAPLMPSASFDVTWSAQPTSTFGFQFQALGFGGGGGGEAEAPTGAGSPTGTGTTTGTTTGAPPAAAPAAPVLPELFHSGQAALNLRWNVDWFGRQALAWRASHHEARAAEGDQAASRLAIAYAAAEAWFDLVVAGERLALLERQIVVQEQLLDLVRLRFEAGSASGVDLLQQQQALATTQALLPTAQAAASARRAQLDTLLGRAPTPFERLAQKLPEVGDLPPLGRPIDLLAQRPELRAAADRHLASEERQKSAALGLAPRLSAQAAFGRQYTWLVDYDDQPFYSLGATLSVPLFSGGQTWAGIRQARGAAVSAEAAWEGAWLLALQEVEAAVALDIGRRSALEANLRQQAAARQAFDQARDRYLAGLDPYANVLIAQAAWQNAELTCLSARRDALSARLQVFDALGGNWPELDSSWENR
jgi:multidrug efflux system outer membrane protein